MHKIITTIGFLIFSSNVLASDIEPNGHLIDECWLSISKLEEMFVVYDDINDFNPAIHVHLSRMNMLINMLSFCSESGLLPMEGSMLDKNKTNK